MFNTFSVLVSSGHTLNRHSIEKGVYGFAFQFHTIRRSTWSIEFNSKGNRIIQNALLDRISEQCCTEQMGHLWTGNTSLVWSHTYKQV